MKKLVALFLGMAMLLSAAFACAEATGADVKGTGETLTIYTNSGDSGRADWLKERAAQDGFDVVILEEGAGAVQQRLIGEAANPIADVVYGLNAIIWNDLIARDILVPYDAPSWASEVSEGLNDRTVTITRSSSRRSCWPMIPLRSARRKRRRTGRIFGRTRRFTANTAWRPR